MISDRVKMFVLLYLFYILAVCNYANQTILVPYISQSYGALEHIIIYSILSSNERRGRIWGKVKKAQKTFFEISFLHS